MYYVRRKVFSKVEDQETGEIKLFSTNEVELSESEKIYSVLMDEEELSLFSDFLDELDEIEKEFSDSKDDTKLKLSDRMSIGMYKHLYGKRARKNERDRIDGVDTSKKDAKQAAIAGGLIGAGLGAVAGGAKGAAIGGAAMAAGSAAGAYVGSKGGTAARRALEKRSEKYKASWDKQRDRLDVAEGKMSKEEYAKKHYKK